MSAANLNNQIKSIMAAVKNGQPTFIQQEQLFNLTEDLAVAVDVTDDPPMAKEERDERMKIANIFEEKRSIYNKAVTELKALAISGDAVAQNTLKKAEFEKDVAMDNYLNLDDRIEKFKLQRRQIEKVRGGGKRRKTRKSRKTRKHRK
jgi:hypothetical protein